jgi:hypothetical protein
MRAKIKINKTQMLKEYLAQPKGRFAAAKVVQEEFEDILNEARIDFLVDLDTHPVSKEIEAGPDPSVKNTSGTLSGYGNLFSFIGFEKESDPVGYIKSLFFKKTGITKVRLQNAGKGRFLVETQIPTKEEIYSDPKTHIPWQPGRSWLDGIEKGISGFGWYYLKKVFYSRSGEALQAKTDEPLREGKFKTTKYFSEIYNKFLRRITKGSL